MGNLNFQAHESIFGPLLVSCIVSTYLFGINSSQTWIYLRSFPNDRWQMKTFIVVVWFLELIHTILVGWMAYGSLVTNFGANNFKFTPLDLDSLLFISNFISVSIASLVQLFFVYRLRKLSNSTVIPVIASILSISRLSCYAAVTIQHLLNRTQSISTVWLWSLFSVGILTVTSDLLVAVGLSYSLWKRRVLWKAYSENASWWPRIIDQLIIISLQSDVFICMISTTTLIVSHVSNNFSWSAVSLVACRLFSISCLASIFSARSLSRKEGDIPSLAVILNSSATIPPGPVFTPRHMLEMTRSRSPTTNGHLSPSIQ